MGILSYLLFLSNWFHIIFWLATSFVFHHKITTQNNIFSTTITLFNYISSFLEIYIHSANNNFCLNFFRALCYCCIFEQYLKKMFFFPQFIFPCKMNLSSLCWEGNHRFWKKDKIFQQKKRLKIKESCGFEEKKLQMFGVLVKCLSLENLEFERLHFKIIWKVGR